MTVPAQSRSAAPGVIVSALGLVVLLSLSLLGLGRHLPAQSPQADGVAALDELPLSFVPNKGQIDPAVRFYSQGAGRAFYFTSGKAVLAFTKGDRGVVLHLTPLGVDAGARLEAGKPGTGKVNYIVGAQRHRNLPIYHEVAYRDLWPGIDLVFRGRGGTLKYEFQVRPGADPARIGLAYRGADVLSLGAGGALLVETPLGNLRDSRPRSFQRVNGKRVPVSSRYLLKGGTRYGFAVGAYDGARPLVIDPGVVYSTFLGGGNFDGGEGITVDTAGNTYVTGATDSVNFPTTPGAYDTTANGGLGTDVFVTKLNPAGSAVIYSTYFGQSGNEAGADIAVDAAGNAYVTGLTQGGVPTTAGAAQPGYGGVVDAFVTKFNPSGSALVYSTHLGGSNEDHGYGIAVDGAGNAYVAGEAGAGFPSTPGAWDPTHTANGFSDGFVTKLNATGSALVYSTFLGGTTVDLAYGIDLDGSGNAYAVGRTTSSNFPTTVGAYDTALGGNQDGFVTKLNASGSAAGYSTYLGGAGSGGAGDDAASDVAVDDAGSAHVTGITGSPAFPTTPGAYDSVLSNGASFTDAFVTKLTPGGSALEYSTYLGGGNSEIGPSVGGAAVGGIALDEKGAVWVTGVTQSSNFPTTPGAIDTTVDAQEAFATKLYPVSGTGLTYSTVMGGSGTDEGIDVTMGPAGSAYFTGTATSGYPVSAGAFDTSHNGSADAFVLALDDDFDGDGLPDSWETQGLTVGGDFVDLPAMGAEPDHKDIFVEVDYMQVPAGHTHKPHAGAISTIVNAFDDAPVNNPDGTTGIHLHVDYGSSAPLPWGGAATWGALSKSDSLTEQMNIGTGAGTDADPYTWGDFDVIKDANFTAARTAVFHYNVWAHNLSPALGASSGYSRGIEASDFIVSLGSWAASVGAQEEQGGTFMHELGHNLGLEHGGDEDPNYKPNYLSVMNYSFQTRGLIVDGREFNYDYSRQVLPALDETNLDETVGIQTSMGTRWFCGLDDQEVDANGNAVDWDCDGSPDDGQPPAPGVVANINQGTTFTNNSTTTTLTGSEDWSRLVYNGGAIGGLGDVALPATTVLNEITQEEDALLPDLPAGYPRPKSASPLRVPLVPAYAQCGAPNRTHGPPLAFGSCNPPARESGQLTVGTPDANGQPAASVGFARYATIVGVPGGVDDADVKVSFEVTDVRMQGTLADYTGELQGTTVARITDRRNGVDANGSATITDLSFPVTVPCAATGGSVGATCSVTTTFDSVLPGAIPEGDRSIWELGRVTATDGGPDGDVDTGPNTLFAVQGVFIP